MSTIIPERLAALDTITLDKSSHASFEQGHCAMEVVAWLAGLGHTDAPECASRVLRSYTIGLNDQWEGERRQKLVPFLPRMVGTAGDGQDEARSFLALDWLIRTFTPAWLDLAGLSEEATALRDLRRIVDLVAAEQVGPIVRAARAKSTAARDAARDAAYAAARAVAGDAAARVASYAAHAAHAAARAAAGDAAYAYATPAAHAAEDAAVAAGDAAEAAAYDDAASASYAAGAAAWDAAWDALRPTVETLQASALDLLDRMIDPSSSRKVA